MERTETNEVKVIRTNKDKSNPQIRSNKDKGNPNIWTNKPNKTNGTTKQLYYGKDKKRFITVDAADYEWLKDYSLNVGDCKGRPRTVVNGKKLMFTV